MRLSYRSSMLSCTVVFLAVSQAIAQGAREDYQRAQRFLPGNLRSLVSSSDITPNWIEKTNRFWYRKTDAKGSEFILIDADKNTSGPAFDHEKLAAALSHAARHEYRAKEFPFFVFEFTESGNAVRFQLENAPWTCALSDYQCKQDPGTREHPGEVLSPNKQWAAYVKDHNLCLRNVSTGEVVQLTSDGIAGWDYATPLPSLRALINQGSEETREAPAVFWSPDSSHG